jgi:hypothetical protein
MIINDKDALRRLDSPMNLINKIKSSSPRSGPQSGAMSLFGIGRKKEEEIKIVSNSADISLREPHTTLDTILENNESQIKLSLAHDQALELLNNSVSLLATKLDDIRADRLPSVVSAAGKIVESIRKERIANRGNDSEREVHFHFYTPQQKTISDYEIVEVQ